MHLKWLLFLWNNLQLWHLHAACIHTDHMLQFTWHTSFITHLVNIWQCIKSGYRHSLWHTFNLQVNLMDNSSMKLDHAGKSVNINNSNIMKHCAFVTSWQRTMQSSKSITLTKWSDPHAYKHPLICQPWRLIKVVVKTILSQYRNIEVGCFQMKLGELHSRPVLWRRCHNSITLLFEYLGNEIFNFYMYLLFFLPLQHYRTWRWRLLAAVVLFYLTPYIVSIVKDR